MKKYNQPTNLVNSKINHQSFFAEGALLLFCWIFCGNLGAQNPIFTASQHLAGNGDIVQMDISVENFDSIGTFQFSMQWNPDILQFQTTDNYGFMDFSESNFGTNGVSEGLLTTLWFDQTLQGVSLANESILFSILFEVLGQEGDSSFLEFINEPTDIFVAKLNGTSIEAVDADFLNGKVNVISTQIILAAETLDNPCFGEELGLINLDILGGLSPYEIEWTGPNNFSSTEQNLVNLPPGIYTVLVTDAFGTTATETYEINAPSAPLSITNVATQQSNCDSETGQINLDLSGGTMPYSINFGAGFSANLSAEDLPAGNYSIQVVDANNCALDTAAIVGQAQAEIIDLGQDTSICENEILFLSAGEFNGTLQWFQDGNLLDSEESALEIFETGEYLATVVNEFGCIASDTVSVLLKELEITTSPDTTIFRGMDVELFAAGGTNYLWSPAEFLSCELCPNPIASPIRDTYFYVEISSPNGCMTTDSIFVNISNDLELVIDPINFMSPNGDDKNDRLVFQGLEQFPQNSLIIYNRWGTKIYNAINYQQNGQFWDGTLNGRELPAGVYFYVLKVDSNGTEIRSSLTLTY